MAAKLAPDRNSQSPVSNISAVVTRRIFLVVSLLFTGILYWFSEQPMAAGLLVPPYDKVAHATGGAVLALLLWFGFAQRGWVYIGLLVSLASAFEEWHQSFLPGRVPDAADFMFASIGAWVILLLLRFFIAPKTR